MREEAGLDGEPCGIVSVRTRVTKEGGAVFVGFRICCDSGEPALDGHEVDAVQLFGCDELLTLNPAMGLSRHIALVVSEAPGVEWVETDIPERSALKYKAYLPSTLSSKGA